MNEENKIDSQLAEFQMLLEAHPVKTPKVGDLITGIVLSASKAEVRLDIEGVITGSVRGPELYEEDGDYADLKPGDSVEATVIDTDNENGELELSFRVAGQEKAWAGLNEAFESKAVIKVKVADANKGGLLVKYRQIPGFLPVSQLAPENYPRVSGGDKSKILDRLRSYEGQEFSVKVMTLDTKEDKIIFSEKEAWNEKQADVISKYKVGTVVDGTITAITDFGVFLSFGENLEGLVHISELAWQRIENPGDLFKVGDRLEAEVISLENSKIFLSAKKLQKDPWEGVTEKYKIGQIVSGTVLKVNPFGLFVSLDEDIHGLAHISQIGLKPKQKINEAFGTGEVRDFTVVSIEPKEHRLGLMYGGADQAPSADEKTADEKDSAEKKSAKKDAGKTEEKDAKRSKAKKDANTEKESREKE